MKLLHVVPTYLPATRYGGPIYSVHGLCKALVRQGHAVDVFTTNVDGPRDSAVPLEVPVEMDGIRVHYHRCRFPRRLYFSATLARSLHERVRDYDLVHLHSVFLWPTLVAARSAASAEIPYLVSPRGMLVKQLIERKSPAVKRLWIQVFERRNLQAASALHFTTPSEQEAYRHLDLPQVPGFVVPNGCDVPASPPVYDSETAAQTILYLGRISWEKGLDRLIPALRHVPAARLVVAGNDEEGLVPKLLIIAKRSGVADRVVFVESVSGERKEALFRQAAFLVLPSHSENFGNVVLEAWARARPVVVTPEVGLAAAVRDSGGGLVAEGDPSVLGAAMQTLLVDGQRRKDMGWRGWRYARDHYGWDSVARLMSRRYQDIVSNRSRLA